MKLISIVTPCYNEEDNIQEVYQQVKDVFSGLPNYRYEHIFIDNCSKDKTVFKLRKIAEIDHNVKIIINTRNFGHIRSPYYGLLQGNGDATILIVADLQDPPKMIIDFISKWEEGYKVVLGVKTQSEETKSMFFIRNLYYNFINRLSDIELTKNNTGFGLYDKEVINLLKEIGDPYPYFRGLISEIGHESAKIVYTQPRRKKGITKNNFYTLYDLAMLGITNHSRIPLRISTMVGFLMGSISLLIALVYLIAKLLFWNSFPMGTAPIIISIFFFASIQLFFIGILGEYIGAIYTQVLKRPLVVEKERVNFED
jgi:polyisoprenyl-phosphate glycosyltransferase